MGMNGMLTLLLAGLIAGILASTMALLWGCSWLVAFGFYVLGGNIGLLLTGALMARAREDLDSETYTLEE